MTNKSDWIDTLNLEEAVTSEVMICGERINNSGVWWQVSKNYKNIEVYSCRHAIKYRDRLGSGDNGGIPLWAELKSLVGVAVDSTTNMSIYFAAHTRANTEFSEPLILKALGIEAAKSNIDKILDTDVSPDSNSTHVNKSPILEPKISESDYFGKVNPFNIDLILSECMDAEVEIEDIFQIFDESLELHGGFPNTIMSNLGDRRLAFEMHTTDLINVVKKLSPKSIVTKIAYPCPVWLGIKGEPRKDYWLQFPPPTGPKIGVLTGNAPESGLILFEDTLIAFRSQYANMADVLMPEMYIHSLPQMGLSMELVSRDDYVWNEVKNAVIKLLEVGCKIITLACNTTIYYEPRIIELCDKI